jgi:hypothetical protein
MNAIIEIFVAIMRDVLTSKDYINANANPVMKKLSKRLKADAETLMNVYLVECHAAPMPDVLTLMAATNVFAKTVLSATPHWVANVTFFKYIFVMQSINQ